MNKVKRISASQLGMFTECPRKWWAHYVKKIKRQPPSDAMKIGLAVHKILEVSLLAAKKGIDKYTDPRSLLEAAVTEYQLGVGDRARLDMMLENAIRMGWFDDTEHAHPEHEQIYKIDDTEVIVKIDMLLETSEHARIIDLKSGKHPYEKGTLKENWQTRFYTLPFLEKFDQVKMEFWFLRFFHKNISCIIDKEYREVILADVRKLITDMKACEGKEYKQNRLCQWCPFFDECQKMNKEN